MKLKDKFKDKYRRRVIIKHIYMYFMFFLSNVIMCIITLFSVKHALKIDLDFIDTNHTIHLVCYIIFTFSTFFLILYSLVQRSAITIPVFRIRERLSKMRNGDFKTVMPKVKSFIDISEFNPIIEDINITAQELNSMQNLSQDFINNVSHEFKTPLAVINNYTKLLRNDSLSEDKRKEYLDVIENSVKDMNSLVTNALMLNRVEHQTIYANIERFDLSEQIAETIFNFESQIEEKQLNIDVNFEDDLIISSEKNLTSHVWSNIISNAIKFTDVGGTIKISTEKIDDVAVVSISDNGCGISDEDKQQIFDKYFQANNIAHENGNGLGLSLVKRICDVLNMKISFISELGKGTTFVISIEM